MRTAVVGHVEWITFARVDHVPASGEIVHGGDVFEVPGGGGPVVAVQLLKLADNCTFYTAFGDDELGHRAKRELEALGVRVEAVFRDEPQRRAFVHVDAAAERTITVLGPRLGPHASDPLPWDELEQADTVFFCAGDDDALRQARKARVLVATTREAERLARVAVELDAAVGSLRDAGERYIPFEPAPALLVGTQSRKGGVYTVAGDTATRGFPAAPLPGPLADSYGAGDCFVAGITYALGAGMQPDDAVTLAARCGAACITGRGPFEGQLTSNDL